MKTKGRRQSSNLEDRRDEARANEATRSERLVRTLANNDDVQKIVKEIRDYKPESDIEKKSAQDVENAAKSDQDSRLNKAREKYTAAKKKYDASRLERRRRIQPKG